MYQRYALFMLMFGNNLTVGDTDSGDVRSAIAGQRRSQRLIRSMLQVPIGRGQDSRVRAIAAFNGRWRRVLMNHIDNYSPAKVLAQRATRAWSIAFKKSSSMRAFQDCTEESLHPY